MSNPNSFADSFNVVNPTDAEAKLRDRYQEVFKEEGAEIPGGQTNDRGYTSPSKFRYNDEGTRFRPLNADQQQWLNEGHMSAHGRELVMARLQQQLEGGCDKKGGKRTVTKDIDGDAKRQRDGKKGNDGDMKRQRKDVRKSPLK